MLSQFMVAISATFCLLDGWETFIDPLNAHFQMYSEQ